MWSCCLSTTTGCCCAACRQQLPHTEASCTWDPTERLKRPMDGIMLDDACSPHLARTSPPQATWPGVYDQSALTAPAGPTAWASWHRQAGAELSVSTIYHQTLFPWSSRVCRGPGPTLVVKQDIYAIPRCGEKGTRIVLPSPPIRCQGHSCRLTLLPGLAPFPSASLGWALGPQGASPGLTLMGWSDDGGL